MRFLDGVHLPCCVGLHFVAVDHDLEILASSGLSSNSSVSSWKAFANEFPMAASSASSATKSGQSKIFLEPEQTDEVFILVC